MTVGRHNVSHVEIADLEESNLIVMIVDSEKGIVKISVKMSRHTLPLLPDQGRYRNVRI